ncbi:hypothetical protein Cgig2_010292 [Carnegiea gigantea]|uniref:CN hydrolase domain-containing protein n=1 Tax=Carnegiea gigantea TaxID=171969 RepID=A0A9Q1KI85_9CARY|nr:hypothetical protein Cgig2_010292 [Carnegiea gigantea]
MRNIAHARDAIEEAATRARELVLLPAGVVGGGGDPDAATLSLKFECESPYSNDSFPVYAEDIEWVVMLLPQQQCYLKFARSLKVTMNWWLHFQRSVIHLFDIDIPGQMTFKESKTLNRRESHHCGHRDVGRIGIGIFMISGSQELAWQLCSQRAADNQLYVATCSPARDTSSGYVAWGHSTLVGPYGEVLATTEHDEAIVVAEVDYLLIEQRRLYLPFINQRRGDLYQLVDVQRLSSEAVK